MITEGHQDSLKHTRNILRGKLTPYQKINHLRKGNTTNQILLRITPRNNTVGLNTRNGGPPPGGTHPEYILK
jgi:hypothetical protein